MCSHRRPVLFKRHKVCVSLEIRAVRDEIISLGEKKSYFVSLRFCDDDYFLTKLSKSSL